VNFGFIRRHPTPHVLQKRYEVQISARPVQRRFCLIYRPTYTASLTAVELIYFAPSACLSLLTADINNTVTRAHLIHPCVANQNTQLVRLRTVRPSLIPSLLSRLHRLSVTSRIKYRLTTIIQNSLSIALPSICTFYFSSTTQFRLLIQENLLANAPWAIRHLHYRMASDSGICDRLLCALLTYICINVKKLQFIHTVNGDGSKTAKIIKRQC